VDKPLAIALVGGLLGGAFAAVVGGIITLTAQRREHRARSTEADASRKHELRLAHEARIQDRRAAAYERILLHVYRLDTWVQRTEPMMGPKPDPPEDASDDEMYAVNAITAAHASPEVQRLVEEMSLRAREFQVDVWRLRHEKATGRDTPGMPPAGLELHKHREAFYAAVRALAEQINAELRA
jgi:hypothetical protein